VSPQERAVRTRRALFFGFDDATTGERCGASGLLGRGLAEGPFVE